MSTFHHELSAVYTINKKQYQVVLCWEGKEADDDPDSFYDVFDSNGICLNEGSPLPTLESVLEWIKDRLK